MAYKLKDCFRAYIESMRCVRAHAGCVLHTCVYVYVPVCARMRLTYVWLAGPPPQVRLQLAARLWQLLVHGHRVTNSLQLQNPIRHQTENPDRLNADSNKWDDVWAMSLA